MVGCGVKSMGEVDLVGGYLHLSQPPIPTTCSHHQARWAPAATIANNKATLPVTAPHPDKQAIAPDMRTDMAAGAATTEKVGSATRIDSYK